MEDRKKPPAPAKPAAASPAPAPAKPAAASPAPAPAKPAAASPAPAPAPVNVPVPVPVPGRVPGLPTKESVLEALRPVHDPELMISIVDLGLIYDVAVSPDGKGLEVKMTLTSPGCPIGPELMAAVDHTARLIPGVADVHVQLVWDPPWDPTKMASEQAREQLGIW
jgi:metal-sulfur cluster biosynthetic enzyme